MLLAVIWGTVLFVFNRSFFWWNTPVLIPLLLSVPLSVWSSQAGLGRTLQNMGLLLIPEETEKPEELQNLDCILLQEEAPSPLPVKKEAGFVRAVVDPEVHALHLCLNRKEGRVMEKISARRRRLIAKALSKGPGELTPKEKREILYDTGCFQELHRRVWEISDPALERQWGLPP
jgi:membrane glycosyltransferase